MTRRPLLLLAAILLALLIAAFVLWLWVGLLRELSQVSTPIGQDAARTTPTAASRDFARPVLPVSPDPAAESAARTTSPSASATAPTGARSVATQGPAVDVSTVSAAGLSVPTDAQLAALRWCESRGQYGINTGNGYYGAYQFDLRTWHGIGETGRPDLAAPAVQDAAVRRLFVLRGWQPWPVCGRVAGVVTR